MRIPRLHIDTTLSPGAELVLAEDRAHYLTRVLRRNSGDALWVFDGRGSRIDAVVGAVHKRQVVLRLGGELVTTPATAAPVTLAMALLKGDAFDDVLRQATELGVDAVMPLITERTEGKLPDDTARAQRRQDHWRSVAVSACEQCGRDWVPTVHAAVPMAAWLASMAGADAGLGVLLEPTAAARMAGLAGAVHGAVTLAIGPEGGWSAVERRAAAAAGIVDIALGTPVLRAETAPAAALAMLSLLRQLPAATAGV